MYSDNSVDNNYYVDLRKITEDVPGVWEWGDGSLLNYQDQWRAGDPDQPTKMRASIKKNVGLMADSEGTANYHFICEK